MLSGDFRDRSIMGPRKCVQQIHHPFNWVRSLGSQNHLVPVPCGDGGANQIGSGGPLCPAQSCEGRIVPPQYSSERFGGPRTSEPTAPKGPGSLCVDGSSQQPRLLTVASRKCFSGRQEPMGRFSLDVSRWSTTMGQQDVFPWA